MGSLPSVTSCTSLADQQNHHIARFFRLQLTSRCVHFRIWIPIRAFGFFAWCIQVFCWGKLSNDILINYHPIQYLFMQQVDEWLDDWNILVMHSIAMQGDRYSSPVRALRNVKQFLHWLPPLSGGTWWCLHKAIQLTFRVFRVQGKLGTSEGSTKIH